MREWERPPEPRNPFLIKFTIMPTQVQTRLIDGRQIAREIKQEVGEQVGRLSALGFQPGLAVVLVGDNPASQVYVRNKTRSCEELGIHSEQVNLPASASTREVLSAIGQLNQSDHIDGVLVQLPLPDHIDADRILRAVHPVKDVDGFHPVNVGKLCTGKPSFVPCTPAGILEMLTREEVPMVGERAVVIGRSNIVGKPLALLLLREHCTVTLCHSRTRDLPGVSSQADILVAAVGRAGLVTGDFIKPGATVIDVGMNRAETLSQVRHLFGEDPKRLETFRKRGSCLVGDVHPLQAMGVAGALTPVPGGVGPLTIARLMKNTVLACEWRRLQAKRSS